LNWHDAERQDFTARQSSWWALMVYQYLNCEKNGIGKMRATRLVARIKPFTNKELDKEMPGTKARRSPTGRYKEARPLYDVFL
jgi:hypothetical protein